MNLKVKERGGCLDVGGGDGVWFWFRERERERWCLVLVWSLVLQGDQGIERLKGMRMRDWATRGLDLGSL